MSENNLGEIIVYQSDDGLTHVDVRFEGDSVWLTQAQLIQLYHSSKSNISEHIKHIFEDGELSEEATVRKFRTVQIEGNRQVSREVIQKAVVLTGVVAECCVLATLMDAIDMGYEVVYLYDGIAGTSEKDEQMILRLAGYFAPVHVTVMSCAEYIAAISGDAGDP